MANNSRTDKNVGTNYLYPFTSCVLAEPEMEIFVLSEGRFIFSEPKSCCILTCVQTKFSALFVSHGLVRASNPSNDEN